MDSFFDVSLFDKIFYKNKQNEKTYGDFFSQCIAFSKTLPKEKYIINLCEDRYLFSLSFFAIILAGKTNLLPHNKTDGAIKKLKKSYKDLSILQDIDIDLSIFKNTTQNIKLSTNTPVINDDHIAAIMFTSGSTGEPTSHVKPWKIFAGIGEQIAQRFDLNKTTDSYIVATVPQQHMYGLETSIVLPFSGYASSYFKTAFYPKDIAEVFEMADKNEKKILITTPLHLDILDRSEEKCLQNIDLIICATAPLSDELAQKVESKYNACVCEIYGCTEAGVVATRRTIEGDIWHLLDDFSMKFENEKIGEASIYSKRIAESILLPDIIKIIDKNRFTLHGRQADMLNIAGKRASLSGLNTILKKIDGVEDAIFFQPKKKNKKIEEAERFVAFVVGNKSQAEILNELKKEIDPVFLPRKIYNIKKIPRNTIGKIQLKDIEKLYKNES